MLYELKLSIIIDITYFAREFGVLVLQTLIQIRGLTIKSSISLSCI